MDLTILIPTYNRKKQLWMTLSALQNQTDSDFNIIISDNASNYNISEMISDFSEPFKKKIQIHSRLRNVGADANIIGLFGLCDKGWVWTLSDDDILHEDAVAIIKHYIEIHPDAGCLDFFQPTNMKNEEGESIVLKNINEFADFYTENPQPNSLWHGDLIFLSNKVFNLDRMGQYIEYAYRYIYTRISTVVIFSYMLADNVHFVIINKQILDVNRNGEGGWNTLEIYMASRTLGDMILPCDSETTRKILRVLAFDIRDLLYIYFEDERGKQYKNFWRKMYVDLYRDILEFKYRAFICVIVFFLFFPNGYNISRKIVRTTFGILGRKDRLAQE